MPIVKTKKESLGKVVTRPSGDNPYYLVEVSQSEVEEKGLEDKVVEDTSSFLSQYDLGSDEEEEDLLK